MSAPDLVYINPNVQVIADYDEPIFYTGNYYWHQQGSAWYRSSSYTGGWIRIATAPVAILQIDRPSAYVHYHAKAAVVAQPAAPHDQRDEAHERRDERHDEKVEQKEIKAEQKDERHDAKVEQKEIKADQKQERKDDRKDDHKDKDKSPKGH